jgi:hypothetical protein
VGSIPTASTSIKATDIEIPQSVRSFVAQVMRCGGAGNRLLPIEVGAEIGDCPRLC